MGHGADDRDGVEQLLERNADRSTPTPAASWVRSSRPEIEVWTDLVSAADLHSTAASWAFSFSTPRTTSLLRGVRGAHPTLRSLPPRQCPRASMERRCS